MAGNLLQEFFGDDLEEALDSIKSVPGAFGNIFLAAVRQVRLLDALAVAVVLAGWAWFIGGYLIAGESSAALLILSIAPTIAWLAAGVAGGLVFHISAIGMRSLAYWEAYLLILLFAAFGVISLRLALDPRGRRVYRAATGTTPDA